MVAAIDQRHPGRRVPQRTRRIQPAEPAADDDDAWIGHY